MSTVTFHRQKPLHLREASVTNVHKYYSFRGQADRKARYVTGLKREFVTSYFYIQNLVNKKLSYLGDIVTSSWHILHGINSFFGSFPWHHVLTVVCTNCHVILKRLTLFSIIHWILYHIFQVACELQYCKLHTWLIF